MITRVLPCLPSMHAGRRPGRALEEVVTKSPSCSHTYMSHVCRFNVQHQRTLKLISTSLLIFKGVNLSPCTLRLLIPQSHLFTTQSSCVARVAPRTAATSAASAASAAVSSFPPDPQTSHRCSAQTQHSACHSSSTSCTRDRALRCQRSATTTTLMRW